MDEYENCEEIIETEEKFCRFDVNDHIWIKKDNTYYLYPICYSKSFDLVKGFASGVHWGHCNLDSIKPLKKLCKVVRITDFEKLKAIVDQVTFKI